MEDKSDHSRAQRQEADTQKENILFYLVLPNRTPHSWVKAHKFPTLSYSYSEMNAEVRSGTEATNYVIAFQRATE